MHSRVFELIEQTAGQRLDALMTRYLRDEFALVGIGRLHLSNPDFVQKIREGAPLNGYAQRYLSELI